LYLLAMGLGLGAYLSHIKGVSYIDFIAPGLIATAAMYGTSFEVTFNCFVKMQFGKIYDAVMATPLSIEDIGLGELLWGTTRATIYGLVFLVLGLSFTAIVPLIDYFTYYWTLFITPMFLFSGVFFPLTKWPAWAQ